MNIYTNVNIQRFVALSDKYLATGSEGKSVILIDIQTKAIYPIFRIIHRGNIYNEVYSLFFIIF